MLDIGDPAFKLFGKTIPLVSSDEVSGDSNDAAVSSEHSEEKDDAQKGQAEQKSTDESVLTDDPSATSATKNKLNSDVQTATKKGTSSSSEDQNSPNSVDENSAAESQKDDEESKNSPEKSMNKPDKILPCPRCNSMDTKFCYYNNYNVNQPRHFCKSCHRYWTAGGSMRNVPVGAGRRKNKTSTSSKYCHLSISEALRNGLHHPHKQPDSNATVLNFGADPPLCDSMESMMNIGEKKILNGTPNGVYVNRRNKESGDTRSSMEEGGLKPGANPIYQIPHNMQNFTGQQVFLGFQLGYGYPMVSLAPPPLGFFPPMPIYPTPYWNGATFPWVSPISLSPKSPGSYPNSPTLGKHLREEDTLNTSRDVQKSLGSSQVLVPKTLRIDDPEEAAKSSIWTTLGIKKVEPAGNGGFFKGLQSKSDDKKHKMESFPMRNENPAALARSISFQETA